MRIYFVGPHSSGKSTLARHTSKEWSLPLITEVARTVLAEKELMFDSLRVNLDMVDNYQEEVFLRQFAEEDKMQGSYISDRSFENIAYAAMHSRIFGKLIKEPKLLEYIENLKKPDVAIFFVRPCRATLRADGVRENPVWDGVLKIDATIQTLLEMFELDYVSINTENMQERIKTVNTVLRLMKNN